MSKIFFRDPSGDNFGEFSSDEIKEFILQKGDEFWDIGAGDAGIDFIDDGEKKSHIHLKGLEDYGFMIDHEYKKKNSDMFTLTTGVATEEAVEAYIGGNPNLYYRKYFVPKEMAWQAVEYFIKTGDRHPNLTWEIAEMPEQEF